MIARKVRSNLRRNPSIPDFKAEDGAGVGRKEGFKKCKTAAEPLVANHHPGNLVEENRHT